MKDAYPQRTNCTAICCMKGFTLLTLSLCYDWVTWCFALLVRSWAHRTQLRSLQGLPSLHPRGSPCHSASHFPVLPFPLMLIPRCPVLLSPAGSSVMDPGWPLSYSALPHPPMATFSLAARLTTISPLTVPLHLPPQFESHLLLPPLALGPDLFLSHVELERTHCHLLWNLPRVPPGSARASVALFSSSSKHL